MKNLSPRFIGITTFAVVGGLCLGFIQDGITTSLASLPALCLSIIYVGGLIGWFAGVVWYAMAFRMPRLRRFGIDPTFGGLGFILACWVFTTIGGTVFFLISEAGSMTLLFAIVLSAGMGMSYNFVLVVLPLFVFWMLRAIPPRSRRGKSRSAR
jgi:hypothetical protein